MASEINSMNVLQLDEAQLLDITAAACVATREEDPAATRNVNICCPWGEFMTRELGVGQKAPFDFVTSLVDAEVEFDVIGLQNYFYGRDLLEMERQLETFAGFGKPVHISETEVPAEGRADLSWHGREWNETLQADWLQAAYTLWFSKPFITAITLWDLVDSPYGPHFGIVGPDLVPREAYYRLQSLLQTWKGASV